MHGTNRFAGVASFLLVGCVMVVAGGVRAADVPHAINQGVAKRVVRLDTLRESLLVAEQFRPYGSGYERDDAAFVCDNNSGSTARRGVLQNVVLNQTVAMPLIAEGWSKAEGVDGSLGADYSLYVDIVYTDGTPIWGQYVAFATGTHDWEHRRLTIVPEKPVKSVSFYALFRNKRGKVWFRDLKLSTFSLDSGTAMFDGVAIVAPNADTVKTERGLSLQIRDVKENSDFHTLAPHVFEVETSTKTEPLASGEAANATATSITLTHRAERDRCLTLIYAWRLGDWEQVEFCSMRPRSNAAANTTTGEMLMPTTSYPIGANGRLSKCPFAAVVGGPAGTLRQGRCVGLDLAFPAFFRTGYNAATREIFVAVDLALTKESPSATLRFVTFEFDPNDGLRGAVAQYYRCFPDFFRVRAARQGIWMPFAAISKVPQHEDFGFRFKEGDNEIAWDDAHDMLTFRYTEPMTWWMAMPKDLPATYAAALAQAERLAQQGDAQAKTLFTSGMRREDGQIAHLFQDTPWCVGVVWSLCDLPQIRGGGFAVDWNRKVADKLYPMPRPDRNAGLDGEYVDSSEGYVAAVLDFDRAHFSAASRPLVFSQDTHVPAIFRGLVVYEYVRTMAEDIHARGRLMFANGTPHSLCWLAPYLDVLGTEANWHYGDKWRPDSDDELLFRRVMCGAKPYCFLMNSDFSQWSYEMTERMMKRSLAYGMFPGFFSADASTGHYFTRPELYNRDRDLFKKYVPLCKMIGEAGWQPLTHAQSGDPQIYVERFGEGEQQFWTVFNPSLNETKTTTITFTNAIETVGETEGRGSFVEHVLGTTIPIQSGTITVDLGPEDVLVLEKR